MGLGDWVMATGEVRKLYEYWKRPILVVGAHGRPVWSDVFENNPKIVSSFQKMRCKPRPGQFPTLVDGGGLRPYIAQKTPAKWFWKPYQPTPGEIYLTREEKAFAEPYRGLVMVEPTTKPALGHTNKAWFHERWWEVVRAAPASFVQCSAPGAEMLEGVTVAQTPTFRHACAVLSVCQGFVGTDGGLMHAAAALDIPSVILWSEFTAPSICGYATMRNIRHAGEACGMRTPCEGCLDAMRRISAEEVVHNIKEMLA